MNAVDIVLAILLAFAFYLGFKKGLLVTLTSLIGLIVGIYAAIYFSGFVGGYLSDWFDWDPQMTKWASFAITFFGVVFLANLLGKLMTKVADLTALGLLNKLLGGVFSTAQYALILSVIFLFFGSANLTGYIISEKKKEGSKIYPVVASLAPAVLPTLIQEFNNLKDTLPTELPTSLDPEHE